MANLDHYFPQLLRFEGGYFEDPADPGNASNLGITLRSFQAHAQPLLGIEPSLANLRSLTAQQAEVLYKALYWDPIHGDALATQALAELIFDFYVTVGDGAIANLQSTIGPALSADGRFGPQTLAAVQSADQAALYAQYRQSRIDYYRELARTHPLLQRFVPGWLARADWFPAQLPATE